MRKIPKWDKVFMEMAYVIASRSRDPLTQVGAVVVDKNNRIQGLGFNDMPHKCKGLPWRKEHKQLHKTKFAYIVHAEANALYHCASPVAGSRIYCTLFPCNECVKIMIQLGIKEIVYVKKQNPFSSKILAGEILVKAAKIKVRQLKY